MSLKFNLDTLDGLDEHTKTLYAEKQDGTFQLDVSGVDLDGGENVLKDTLAKERKARADSDRELARLKKQQEDSTRQGLEEQEKFRDLYKIQLEENKALKEAQARSKAKRALKKVVSKLTKNDDKRDSLVALYRKNVNANGEEVEYSWNGVSVTEDDLAAKIKESRPSLVDGVDSSGGGAQGNMTKSGIAPDYSKLSPIEKANMARGIPIN
jgi:hypothetical protein